MLFLIILLISIILLEYALPVMERRNSGRSGEAGVARRLRRLPRNDYIVINDLFLYKDKWTSQIDHVVIGKAGLFVIETKTMKGWIHGNENSQYWYQTIYKHKNRIFNPILQNGSHIKALKAVLREFPQIQYFPIVVFSGQAVLKNVTSELPVLYPHQLIRNIKSHQEKVLSAPERNAIATTLRSLNTTDRKAFRLHKERIFKKKREHRKLLKQGLCPRCQHELVLKRGRYGRFYGCSNFPNCRFTTQA